jgi:carboxyvinyl-carboxyphosphonate phosphorylmutase
MSDQDNPNERRKRLRAILAGSECRHPAAVSDPLTARMAKEIGFELCNLPGSIASLVLLGTPDLVVVTLTELADMVRRICRATDLPLIVDADHGFGNALNVQRSVEELELSGAAGLTIEDTELPAPFANYAKTRLVSREEGLGKIRAALATRRDPDLVILARTAAPMVTDIADTIARITAYAEAGADAIFLLGVATAEQLAKISKAVALPMALGTSGTGDFDNATLAAHRVRIALQSNQPFFAALEAYRQALTLMRAGTPPKEIKAVLPDADLKRLTRDSTYRQQMKDWLGG